MGKIVIINYDFHIHSALSPCGDDEMTPCNIVAMATVKGLQAISVTDHNAIDNVAAATECGEAFGVAVLPGIEVQTSEDIHVVALFDSFDKLEKFYSELIIPYIPNEPEIFGRQQIINSDDEIVGERDGLLLVSCDIGIYELVKLIADRGGKAVLAHIDREANGILAILGAVPDDLGTSILEFSPHASAEMRKQYPTYKILVSSDAHRLESISDAGNTLEVEELSVDAVFAAI